MCIKLIRTMHCHNVDDSLFFESKFKGIVKQRELRDTRRKEELSDLVD